MTSLIPSARQLRPNPTGDYDLFAERWRAPWWYWLAGLILAAAVAAAVHLGYPGLRAVVPYAVTVPFVIGLLWWLSRVEIRITVKALYVDDAWLAREFIADAMPLSREAYRAALGPGFDPLAFVVRRPWITKAVLITLRDPDDPTPYWIISSRRPAALAAALSSKGGASIK